jgi:hypothetical protein
MNDGPGFSFRFKGGGNICEVGRRAREDEAVWVAARSKGHNFGWAGWELGPDPTRVVTGDWS